MSEPNGQPDGAANLLRRLWPRRSHPGGVDEAETASRQAPTPETPLSTEATTDEPSGSAGTARADTVGAALAPAALGEAALAHMDALYRLALRLTRQPEDAEDLVQETYVKALRFAHTFQPGTNLRSWMLKILHTTFLNQYRKEQRTPRVGSLDTMAALDDAGEYYLYNHLLAEQGGGFALTASAEEEALQRLGDEDVHAALNALPEPYHAAVVLADVEGLAYREIAEVLEIPVGTVMSRLSRGRKQLQRLLWERYAPRRPSDKLHPDRRNI